VKNTRDSGHDVVDKFKAEKIEAKEIMDKTLKAFFASGLTDYEDTKDQ
jgi:hypothetical protein